eukprot:361379-Chlamydomonas_euryale.AAC.3
MFDPAKHPDFLGAILGTGVVRGKVRPACAWVQHRHVPGRVRKGPLFLASLTQVAQVAPSTSAYVCPPVHRHSSFAHIYQATHDQRPFLHPHPAASDPSPPETSSRPPPPPPPHLRTHAASAGWRHCGAGRIWRADLGGRRAVGAL